jgi:hypothetical protein
VQFTASIRRLPVSGVVNLNTLGPLQTYFVDESAFLMESISAVPPVSAVDATPVRLDPKYPAVAVFRVEAGVIAVAMVVYVNVTTLVPNPNRNKSPVVAPVALAADPL